MYLIKRIKNLEVFAAVNVLFIDVGIKVTPFDWCFGRDYDGFHVGPVAISIRRVTRDDLD